MVGEFSLWPVRWRARGRLIRVAVGAHAVAAFKFQPDFIIFLRQRYVYVRWPTPSNLSDVEHEIYGNAMRNCDFPRFMKHEHLEIREHFRTTWTRECLHEDPVSFVLTDPRLSPCISSESAYEIRITIFFRHFQSVWIDNLAIVHSVAQKATIMNLDHLDGWY